MKDKNTQGRPPIRGIRKELQINTKEKYAGLYNKFINGDFSYNSHCVIEKLTQNGNKEPHMEGVQLYNILIEITKTLMLNELQILFLGSTVQEMKWKIIQSCLNPYIQEFKGLSQNLKNDKYSKKIQLSLLLIAYIVKLYLNEDLSVFDFKMRQIIKTNYDKMYQEWVQKMKRHFQFSPKNMNKLFKDLQVIKTKQSDEDLQIVNYNNKVQELFTKLVDYDFKDEPKKRNKQQEEEDEDDEEVMQEEYDKDPPPPLSAFARGSSVQSINRQMYPRESFKEILAKNSEIDNFALRKNPSLFKYNSQEEF